MRPSVAASVALIIAGLIAVVALWSSKDRVVATNGIDPAVFVTDLAPGARLCDGAPASHGSGPEYFAVVAGGYGSAVHLVLENSSGLRLSAEGRPESEGRVIFLLPSRTLANLPKVCLRNLGANRVALAGERSASEARVSIYAEDPDPPSWLEKAPSALGAVGDARGAIAGALSGWLVFGLALIACLLAVAVVARSAQPSDNE